MPSEKADPLTPDQFRALYPALRRTAAFVADSDCDPDDLVQEVLAAYLRRFRGSAGASDPLAYLRTAIIGTAKNHRRSAGRERRRGSEQREDAATPIYPSDIAYLLDRLTTIDRGLIELVDVEGESVATAARLVGVSNVAARARLSRARRLLRREIGHDT